MELMVPLVKDCLIYIKMTEDKCNKCGKETNLIEFYDEGFGESFYFCNECLKKNE